MNEIIFYVDRKGRSPVRDYTNALALKNDKDSKNKLKKSAIKFNVLKSMALESANRLLSM